MHPAPENLNLMLHVRICASPSESVFAPCLGSGYKLLVALEY